jgi:hypothetical protein
MDVRRRAIAYAVPFSTMAANDVEISVCIKLSQLLGRQPFLQKLDGTRFGSGASRFSIPIPQDLRPAQTICEKWPETIVEKAQQVLKRH